MVRKLVEGRIMFTPDPMKLSGHLTRCVFDRYDIISGDDLREAAEKLNAAASGR
jgi:hypothetical protein